MDTNALRKELETQEVLIQGFQKENERLVSKLKHQDTLWKAKVDELQAENVKLRSQIKEEEHEAPSQDLLLLQSRIQELEALQQQQSLIINKKQQQDDDNNNEEEEEEEKKDENKSDEVKRIRNFYQKKIQELTRLFEAKIHVARRSDPTNRFHSTPRELDILRAENTALKARIEEMESSPKYSVTESSQLLDDLRKQAATIPVWQSAFERQEAEIEQYIQQIRNLEEENRKLRLIPAPMRQQDFLKRIAELEDKHEKRERALQTLADDVKHRCELDLQLAHVKYKSALEAKEAEIQRFRNELKKLAARIGTSSSI